MMYLGLRRTARKLITCGIANLFWKFWVASKLLLGLIILGGTDVYNTSTVSRLRYDGIVLPPFCGRNIHAQSYSRRFSAVRRVSNSVKDHLSMHRLAEKSKTLTNYFTHDIPERQESSVTARSKARASTMQECKPVPYHQEPINKR